MKNKLLENIFFENKNLKYFSIFFYDIIFEFQRFNVACFPTSRNTVQFDPS